MFAEVNLADGIEFIGLSIRYMMVVTTILLRDGDTRIMGVKAMLGRMMWAPPIIIILMLINKKKWVHNGRPANDFVQF